MPETLLSVGIDVGTTTTQMVLSELTLENRASAFAVPDMAITSRRVRFAGPVHFTPLRDEAHMDGDAIRALLEADYRAAGVRREDVDTGAVIVTGETARRENAAQVAHALSALAGDFVVAAAGPDLESALAARGAGSVDYAARTGEKTVHIDIGGGTSNFAWIDRDGIRATGCLNVGGRLLKFDEAGTVRYVSPVLKGLTNFRVGQRAEEKAVRALALLLTWALEMAAGLREPNELLTQLTTAESSGSCTPPEAGEWTVSFSGGVADCIEREIPWLRYGDLGPVLGRAIRESRLCAGKYRVAHEPIRATVIGAGCHSAQLSGSTVYLRDPALPRKNLPVAHITPEEQTRPDLAALIDRRLAALEGEGVLALPGIASPSYDAVRALAGQIAAGLARRPALLALEADMAKALGHALALRLPPETPVVCIDRVRLPQGCYLDIGAPAGPALPVVVKTLILSH